MSKISIIYHSLYGHTKKVSEYVHTGAKSVSGIQADILTVEEASSMLPELEKYNGFIFGSPTYMGSVSAEFKKFMEKTSRIWSQQTWKNKLAGGFSNSGSLSGDKFNALMQLVTFAAQHSMLWVPLGILNESLESDKIPGSYSLLNRTGSSLGATAQSDSLPPEETPKIGDLKTAQLYGERFAQLALRWTP